MKELIRKFLYNTGLGTLLQRAEWDRQHTARYQIKKIKEGLKTRDRNTGCSFKWNYPAELKDVPGWEYHYDWPDRNDEIIRYFTRRGYAVEKSVYGKNLFIYKRR